jgi:hypothetical protein
MGSAVDGSDVTKFISVICRQAAGFQSTLSPSHTTTGTSVHFCLKKVVSLPLS